MTTRAHPPRTAPRRRAWGPVWARVLAWVALVPAALLFFLGVSLFIQGFDDDALAAVGFIVGAALAFLSLAMAVPGVLFLILRGKPLFITTMCITGLMLLGSALYPLMVVAGQ